MTTTKTRMLATLAVALLATAALAGTTTAQPGEPSAEFDDLVVASDSNWRISGMTTLDEGTEIIVEIRGEDGIREPERVNVRGDGSFSAVFDLRRFEPGTEYTAVVLARNETGSWEPIGETLTGTVVAAPNGSFTYDGDTLLVRNVSEQTIRGETSLKAGTEVVVRVRSAGGSTRPFLKTATATVAENGTFAATFDFVEVPGDTPFVASARADGTDLAEAEGRIVEELPETTTVATTTEATNESGQPGFGVVAALLALCGAALLARRV